MSQFRALLRLSTQWIETGQVEPESEAFKRFQRYLLLVPEHTWGMDEKTHLADYMAYDAAKFQAARHQANFLKFESSWQEQREYLVQAFEALPPDLTREARAALDAIRPERPRLDGFEPVANPAEKLDTAFYQLKFDSHTGALHSLKSRQNGQVWADPRHPLGLFRYETFSQRDYDRFYRQYIINKAAVAFWAVDDFTKPGMEAAGVNHGEWLAGEAKLFRAETEQDDRFLLFLETSKVAEHENGCPKEIWIEWVFSKQQPGIQVTLQWFQKPAYRLPEALWFSFAPANCRSKGWKLLKLGQEVSPRDVVRNGNRHLHAVMPGVRYEDAQKRVAIDSLDAPLVAPGERSLLNFTNRQPPASKGMHFLLYNNIWGTNFPMWFEEDARFRFQLDLQA